MSATQWTVPNNGADADELADLLETDGYINLAKTVRLYCAPSSRTDLAIVGSMVDNSDIHRIKIALKLKNGFR